VSQFICGGFDPSCQKPKTTFFCVLVLVLVLVVGRIRPHTLTRIYSAKTIPTACVLVFFAERYILVEAGSGTAILLREMLKRSELALGFLPDYAKTRLIPHLGDLTHSGQRQGTSFATLQEAKE